MKKEKKEIKKLRIKPPHIAFALLLLSWLLDYFFPEFRFIYGWQRYIGLAIFVSGLTVTFWSFYLFKKNKTPIIPGQKPKFMVAEGSYKFTRNPMYLGVTLALLGISIYIGNLLSLIMPVVFFIIINIIYIPSEERLMENVFGEQYLNYKKKVRRWL